MTTTTGYVTTRRFIGCPVAVDTELLFIFNGWRHIVVLL